MYNLHTCRNVESLLAERGEGVKQLTQDTIEFTPEDLIGLTKMQQLAKQFSLRQKQDGIDKPKGLVGAEWGKSMLFHALTKCNIIKKIMMKSYMYSFQIRKFNL